jgi:putative nucleotidyltransferase with HDIG domain
MMKKIEQFMLYHDLIAGIVAALEARDPYTADHSNRVAEMTQTICGYLHLSKEKTALYHIAAHLHDLGKIGIDDSVLRKKSSLNDEEWAQMKNHPVIGYNILHKIKAFEEISNIVRAHHERWDGNGYPDGLSGKIIPLGARIIAIADSIDAMMSSRPYRSAMSADKCRKEIEKNINHMYDGEIASLALKNWEGLLKKESTPVMQG